MFTKKEKSNGFSFFVEIFWNCILNWMLKCGTQEINRKALKGLNSEFAKYNLEILCTLSFDL